MDPQILKIVDELRGFRPNRPCLQILPQNWKSIVYSTLIIAAKYWDDKYYWNIDVVNRVQMFDIEHMNKYENGILEIL